MQKLNYVNKYITFTKFPYIKLFEHKINFYFFAYKITFVIIVTIIECEKYGFYW